MAGRIRSIKPEILEDERSAALSSDAWRLWVSMWLLADDHGRLRGSLVWLQGQVFWSRDPRETLASIVEELVKASLITCYVIDDQRYIEIRNWQKHQRVDHPSKPRIPAPPLVTDDASRDSRESSRDPRETLAPDLRPPTSDQDQYPDHDPGASESTKRVTGAEIQRAWSKIGVGMPALGELLKILNSLPREILDGYDVAEDFCQAAAKYVAAYLKHKNVKIPLHPDRVMDPKHFGNIVEVMIGKFDVSQLAANGKQEATRPIPKLVGDKYAYADDGE